MASGKQTPRQKMINMMYLVLTALLALNISKDILQALTKLNASLDETVQTIDAKNADIYASFAAAAAENPKKAGPWRDKAMMVKEDSDELYQHIEQLKEKLVELTGGRDEETNLPTGLDNREKVANYLLNQKHATELKKKIEAYRASVKSQVEDSPQLQQNIETIFDTGKQRVGEDGVETSWESANFEHFPLAAVLPFLTDIQAKVRNTESDVISELKRNIGAQDYNFTGLEPVVKAKSTYVTQGDEYEAEVFVAAYDETQKPEIVINGESLPEEQIQNGKGRITLPANQVGEQKWAGMITIKQIGKDPLQIPVEGSYTVAPPTAVISPTKMNVLYRGVENPLEISVPGVDPSKVRVSGPGVSGSNGNYTANVTNVKGTEMNISVSVEEEEGTRTVGSKQFRIKGLPPAMGTIYTKSEGIFSKSAIKGATVEASFQDFPFDLPLTVTSFEVSIPGFPPEKVSGNQMTGQIKQRIDQARPGSTISIRDIQARGPGGLRVTRVGNISVDVN